MKIVKKIININVLIMIFIAISLVSCYSFTGSSLKPDVKTMIIKPFPNNAAYINPNLSQQFSTELQNRFLQRTNLKGATENPDIIIEGEITDYIPATPTSISSSTTAPTGNSVLSAQNKMTITVKVHYENVKYPEESFDRTYSDEAVYSNTMSLQEAERTQVSIVTDRIINKIFNDIVANW